MSFYDKNQNILSEYIREYLNDAYYLKVKNELNQIINENYNILNKNHIKDIKEIINYIKSPQQLLNTNSNVQLNFLLSPTPEHKIFNIEPNLIYIDKIIQNLQFNIDNSNNNDDTSSNSSDSSISIRISSGNSSSNGYNTIDNGDDSNNSLQQLNNIINNIQRIINNNYSKPHRSFINKLVEMVKKEENKTTNLLAPPPTLYSEDLKYYEIKSLDLAYEITSYNPIEHIFKRKNENQAGLSVGSVLDNKVYFKVDKGFSKLLKPAKEHAVYQFYKYLFPTSTSVLLSPTQLILVDNLKILPEEFRRQLGKVMTKHNEHNIEKVLEYEPELRKKVENELNGNQQIFIQASLFNSGIGFDKYLENCEKNNDQSYSTINIESYSSHIIASLLIMPTDYKPDNLILENGTNNIIGIDNDESLEVNEIRKISKDSDALICIKNILYTLKPLMLQEVHPKVREQFIQHNPALFIIKWLLSLEKKTSNYNALISLLLESNGGDKGEINKSLNNKKENINLPLQFNKGWISLMYQRFKLIRQLLISNKTITHQQLFNEIHPLASIYYDLLSIKHPNSPLDIISELYKKNQLSFNEILKSTSFPKIQETYQQILNKTKFSKEDDYISIKDTIKELLLEINFEDLLECRVSNNILIPECGQNCNIMCKSRNIIIQVLTLLLSIFKFKDINIYHESMVEKKDNIYSRLLKYGVASNIKFGSGIIEFHHSWYKSNVDIFTKLLRYGSSVNIIEFIVDNLKVEINNHNYQEIIKQDEIFGNPNICNQIEYLVGRFNLDVEKAEKRTTLLDLAAECNDLNLFIKLIELGAGKFSNAAVIGKFYQKLSNEQKLKLKPYLIKLFTINPKINWKIALNQLFPLQSESNRGDSNRLLSEVTSTTKRTISNKHWDQLFDEKDQIRKLNEYGSRAVSLIQDEFGNGIYLKFKPQFPGTEIAVNKLCELTLGYDLTPCSELASINDIPVLLVQQVPGETLVDVLNDSPSKIIHIDSLNISKQLIMATLINNADGNLGNYILVNNHNSNNNHHQKGNYKLISIDLDQSFMPSVSKSIGFFEKSLQVDTVLFLFNQMNDKVHQDVIDRIESLDVYQVLNKWLESLKYHHQSSLDHFQYSKDKLRKDKETIIGVSFNDGMISHLYSKLKRLQQLFKKATSSKITHLEVLESLEPLIANRYRAFLALDISINDRYIELKNIKNYSKSLVSCSKHPSSQVLLSRDIPNVKDIIEILWSGKYGPSQAINELESLNNNFKSLHTLLIALNDKVGRSSLRISKYDLECLLKTDLVNLPVQNQVQLLSLIKQYQLSIITLRNWSRLNIVDLDSFKLDSITKLELKKCNAFTFFGKITFASLVRLIVDECEGLDRINIDAPNLKAISVINCKRLYRFSCRSPELQYLNLKGSIYLDVKFTPLQKIPFKIVKFKKLEYLNLSGSSYSELNIRSDVKSLDISSMKNLENIKLEVRNIESINFEGCNRLKELTGYDDYCLNINLWKLLNHPINKAKIDKLKTRVNLRSYPCISSAGQVLMSNASGLSVVSADDNFVPLSFLKSHHVLLLPPNSTLNNYKPHIPRCVNFFSLGDGFDEDLDPDFFLPNLFALYLGNIIRPIRNEILPPRLKLLYLGNGYKFNVSDILHPFISNSIETLFLEGIKVPLVPKSIPTNIKHLILCDGYQHQITSDIIPPTLEKLTIVSKKDISIPTSLKFIDFQNDSYSLDIIKPFKGKDLVVGSLLYPVEINSFDLNSPKIIIRYLGKSRINHSNLKQINNLKLDDIKEMFMIKSVSKDCKVIEFWDSPPKSLPFFNQISRNIVNLYLGFLDYIIPLELLPPSITKLELSERFNQTLLPNQIPETVKQLVLGNIQKPLEVGSTSKVSILTFLYGFDQQLKPGIISDSVKELYMNTMKQQLKPNIIPSSVTKLRISILDYQLPPNVIPDSVTNLHISVSNKTLSTLSLPLNIKTLVISTNEPLELNKTGIIPYGVINLYILNFGKDPIQISEFGTIPSTVKLLELRGNFLHLPPQLLPHSIVEMYIDFIKQPLVVGSIPPTVTSLELGNGFCHSLSPGIIPSLIKELYIGNIELPIFKIDSIPWSLQSLNFYVGYKHLLDFERIIPKSVTDLYICYTPVVLDICIPSHVQRLGYGYLINNSIPFKYDSSNIDLIYHNLNKRRENSYNYLNYYYS